MSSIVAVRKAVRALLFRFPANEAEDSTLGLPREFRLRKTSDVQQVQRQGRRIRLPNLMVLFSVGLPGRVRVGLTVSRKVGNAVVRNRVKRWLRETIRTELDGFPMGTDVVMIAHPQSMDAGLEGISSDIRVACQRMSGMRA